MSAPSPSPTRSRSDGEILASPMGTLPMHRRPAGAADLRARPADLRRRGVPARRRAAARRAARAERRRRLDAVPPGLRHRRLGGAARDDGRQPDRPVRQPEHLLHRPAAQPEAPAARRPRRTRQHRQQPRPATGCPSTPRASSSSSVDMVSRRRLRTGGCGWVRSRPLPPAPPGRQRPRGPRLRRRPGPTPMRLVSVHPGVTVEQVGRGHRLRARRRRRDVPTTREPTAEELRLIARCSTRRACGTRRCRHEHACRTLARRFTELAGVRLPDRADRHGLGRRAPAGRRHGRRRRARHPGLAPR